MMIQISESKKEKLSSYAEGIMSMAEKLMECVEKLDSESYGERNSRYDRYPMDERDPYGERESYGERGGSYGNRRGTMRRY